MKVRVRHVAIGALVYNAGLFLATLGSSWQAQVRHPMEGSLIDVDGGRVHVIEAGADDSDASDHAIHDAVVLIHGSSTSALDFGHNLLPALSEGRRVLAVDRPGHGYSERGTRPRMDKPSRQAETILDAMAEMDVENPVLVGHSWAGAVVLAALLSEHEKVRPVAGVLIAGVTHPYAREDSAATRLALAPYRGPVFRWQYLAWIGRLAMPSTVEEFFAPDDVPDDYIERTGLTLSLRPKVYLYNSRDRSALVRNIVEQSGRYERIEVPLLSIAATEDHVVPPSAHHDRLVEAVPGAEAVLIEGAGHLPHHTRTAEVVDAIEKFLGDLN